jgi:hypothetical protein
VDISEKRIVGSLILLAGLTFLSMAAYTGQFTQIMELLTSIFDPAVAGLP